MTTHRILSLALTLMSLGTVTAQTEVTDYQPGVTAEGITYFLPQTAFEVTVTANRTTYTPGEYAAYARRYLRLEGVSLQSYDTWTVTDVRLTPFGVADKRRAYSIKLKTKTSAPLVSLAPDGRLLSVGATSVADDMPRATHQVQALPVKHLNAADYKTEEILSAGSRSKMAELTAAEIYDIRENRSLLTKGQADFMPKDGEQLRLMLAQLDEREEALLSLFKGTTSVESHTYTFTFIPAGAVNDTTLFRFSRYLGLVDADDLAGEPYLLTLTDLGSLPDAVTTADPKGKKEENSLRYVVPGRGRLVINHGSETLLSQDVPMAQFGRIEQLGGDLFNKRYNTRVFLSPVTGGISHIEADQP